jgi:glycosyltransferase involved in cell wall biosynthesis
MDAPTKPIKILHVVTRLDWGGAAVSTMLSARLMVDVRYAVKVVAGAYDGAADENIIIVPRLQRELAPLDDLLALYSLLQIMRRESPDIIHTHTSKAGILGRWAGWLYKILGHPVRIIHSPHGHVFYGYFSRFKAAFFLWVERATAPITDVFIALTEAEKRESEAHIPSSRGRWQVAHSGIDFDSSYEVLMEPGLRRRTRSSRRSEADIPEGSFVVGTVARMTPVKGIGYLLAAAQLLQKSPERFYFLIVGDGELTDSLQRTAREGGLDTVRFVGYRREVLDWMVAMDIYVQPSLNEGMGRTLVQAQALGLPIVASRVCGIPDVVLDNETGILVPPQDARAIADAVLKLHSDDKLREGFGASGHRWVMSPDENGLPRFSQAAMLKRLERIYDSPHCHDTIRSEK